MYEIYKITNNITDDFYIGCTASGLGVRFKDHCRYSSKGYNSKLSKSIHTFGQGNFGIEIIDFHSDKDTAFRLESTYISELQPQYNTTGKLADNGFRVCTTCKKELPNDCFHTSTRGTFGISCKCKSCSSKGRGYEYGKIYTCEHCGEKAKAPAYGRSHGDKCIHIDRRDGWQRCRKCDRLQLETNYYMQSNKRMATCKDCVYISEHSIDTALNSSLPYIRAIALLWRDGEKVQPKGNRTIEIRDLSLEVDYPFASTGHKKFPIDFCRKEFQWYLNADPLDDRITSHATIWKMIQQENGEFSSNYGPLFFADQGGFDDVVRTLREDPSSRQAIIPMAHKLNIFPNNKDQICTLGIFFDIREGLLNMTVTMRSNSMVKFGAPIDFTCFTWLWGMIACKLGIPTGKYLHQAHSAHMYEDDYDLAIEILKDPDNIYVQDYPPITDVQDLLSQTFESDFGQWLTEVKL